jgi:recombination protein RecT
MSELVKGSAREKAAAAKAVLARYAPQIKVMSPRGAPPAEHLLALAYFAISKDPKLAMCTGQTLVASVLESVSMGLQIGVNGQCWLVPFKDKATLIIGYRGMLRLAERSGSVRGMDAYVVREGDDFEFEFGDEPRVRHRRKLNETKYGAVIAAYATCTTVRGYKHVEVMDLDDLERVRRTSKMKDRGAWVDHKEEMYRKCPIRRLFKRAPVSEVAVHAAYLDELSDDPHRDQSTELLSGRILLPEEIPAALLATDEEREAGLAGTLPGQGAPKSGLEAPEEGGEPDRASEGDSGVQLCEDARCGNEATARSIERGDLAMCREHGG